MALVDVTKSCLDSIHQVVDWNLKSDTVSKIAVITSRLLSDAHRYILRCLASHEGVHRCTIFTPISEMAHSSYPDSPLGPDAYHEYESLLVQDYEELVKKSKTKSTLPKDNNLRETSTFEDEGWSQLTSSEGDIPPLESSLTGRDIYDKIGHPEDIGQKLVVSVHHFPMILCPFSPRVFVFPSKGSIAEAYLSAEHKDSLSPGLPPLSTGLFSDGDDVSPGATLTAHFLYHLAAKMDLKMEIFSLGDLSRTVGKILMDMSSLYDVGRRRRSAGLLIVDRTLDLLTPCCHGDSLVDRMFSSLPRRERTISSNQMKGSQTQLKHGPSNLQRAPLDVQIPLQEILREEDCKTDNLRLLESIEAFLCAWDSSNSASQIVDLTNLSKKDNNKGSLNSEVELFSGSFVCTENFRGTPYLQAILDRRTKDGAILVKKWLQETLRRENINVNLKSHPGFAVSQLQPMIKALARSQPSLLRNKGIIQLAAAALVALDESHCARWDAFISAENLLSASAGDTTQSLAAQIGDIVNKSALVGSHQQKDGKTKASQGVLSFQDALLLIVTGYILAGENFPTSGLDGPFSWQEEHLLKEAIVDAILENPSVAKLKFLHGLAEDLEANLNRMRFEETRQVSSNQLQIDDFDDDQWGSWGDEETDNNDKEQVYGDMQLKLELRDRVDNLFRFLHKLSSLKTRNLPLRDGAFTSESSIIGDPYTNKGLLYKLLTRVLGKYDVPGLEYHSSTVGRLFKSGFGRFGLGQAKPSLADQSIIIVFVIGGINGLEVREAQEALSEAGRPDIELIICGTTYLSPDDMLDLLLGDSSYF
ncbi:hypothetical protein I3760_03G187100 [Carya illinoinensis]|nr:hypothetical protein I3760_03G187100 [Carya illinoinensis]KAG2717664.1 hypothetical protein I3760_03G187100 [Carya illinoinensis]